MSDGWPGQVLPLAWLVNKFKPLPGWHETVGAEALKRIRDSVRGRQLNELTLGILGMGLNRGTNDLGRYAAGRSKSVRMDRPGVVRVFCEIHSHMNAFVLVFAHPYFAVTDVEGRYRLKRVPPGEYQLSVRNDGQVRETRTVRVPPEAPVVEQDFSLP